MNTGIARGRTPKTIPSQEPETQKPSTVRGIFVAETPKRPLSAPTARKKVAPVHIGHKAPGEEPVTKASASADGIADDSQCEEVVVVQGAVHRLPPSSSVKMPPPDARERHTSVSYRGDIIMFGGVVGKAASNTMAMFQTSTSRFRRLSYSGDSPPHVAGHSATVCKHYMFVVGGVIASSEAAAAGGDVGCVSVLDLNTLEWTVIPAGRTITAASSGEESTKGRNPCNTKYHSAVEFGGILYVFGGIKERGVKSNAVDMLMLDGVKWAPTSCATGESSHSSFAGTIAPLPRYSHTACRWGSEMIIFGGCSATESPLNDLWSFNFVSKRFSSLAMINLADGASMNSSSSYSSCISPRFGHAAAIVGDSMLVYGGKLADLSFSNSLFELNLASNVCRELAIGSGPSDSMPARAFSSFVMLGRNEDEEGARGEGLAEERDRGLDCSLFVFGGAGPCDNSHSVPLSTTSPAVLTHNSAFFVRLFPESRRRCASPQLGRPSSALGSNNEGGTISAADRQLLRRYRHRMAQSVSSGLFGSPPRTMSPCSVTPGHKWTSAEQQASVKRLAHPTTMTEKIAKLREEMCGLKRPQSASAGSRRVSPAQLADMYYIQTADVERRRQALLNKYLPADHGRKLTKEEMVLVRENAVKQVKNHAAAVQRIAAKVIVPVERKRFASKEEECAVVGRLTVEAANEHKKLMKSLSGKYCAPSTNDAEVAHMSQEAIDEMVKELYAGARRATT